MPIPPDKILQCFPSVLARALGGHHVVEALLQFHEERMTLEMIARWHGLSSPKAAQRLIIQANAALREMGLWSPQWRDKYPREAPLQIPMDVKA